MKRRHALATVVRSLGGIAGMEMALSPSATHPQTTASAGKRPAVESATFLLHESFRHPEL